MSSRASDRTVGLESPDGHAMVRQIDAMDLVVASHDDRRRAGDGQPVVATDVHAIDRHDAVDAGGTDAHQRAVNAQPHAGGIVAGLLQERLAGILDRDQRDVGAADPVQDLPVAVVDHGASADRRGVVTRAAHRHRRNRFVDVDVFGQCLGEQPHAAVARDFGVVGLRYRERSGGVVDGHHAGFVGHRVDHRQAIVTNAVLGVVFRQQAHGLGGTQLQLGGRDGAHRRLRRCDQEGAANALHGDLVA